MDSLTHLKDAEANLKKLQAIKKSKGYIGAGLSITLGVGADDAFPIELQYGCSTDLEVLLDAIIKAQTDYVKFWEKSAKEQMEKLVQYFEGKK